MKVAIVAGVVVPNDAISAAAAGQADALVKSGAVGDVTVFSQHVSRDLPCRHHVVADAWQLLTHPRFEQASHVVLHWGIYYDSYNVVTLLSGSRPKVFTHFHNCTPADLAPPAQRDTIARSMSQVHHAIAAGQRFWTYSEFNRRTLISWGAAPESISFVPFPVDIPAARGRNHSSDQVEFLCVGRLVPAKGQHILVEAIARLPESSRETLRVRIVGSATFSDELYVQNLHARIVGADLAQTIEIIHDIGDAELWRLYQRSDVVVAPSFHEGFCVPIIEGYAAGCRAIGTTAGNLAYIVEPPDQVVTPGSAEELAYAIEAQIALGKQTEIEPHRAAAAERYSVETATRLTLAQLAHNDYLASTTSLLD